METLEAIERRRSIRRFKDAPLADEDIARILQVAIQAPSGKNRQPWRFVVVRSDKRAEIDGVMRKGIAALKERGWDVGSSEWSAKVMEQAPVTIFVFNPYAEPREQRSLDEEFPNVVDVQSVGAAIQNMLLAATDLGIGTLWICDVFYAYRELLGWMGETHQMIAAVALGYPDESPKARPRKTVEEVTRWL